MKYYIGIDVSKLKLDICILKSLDSKDFKQIKNDKKDIKDFFISFDDLNDLTVVFETTSTYSYNLAKVLTDLKIKYSELNPLKVSHFLKYISNKKNDKIDSYNLAYYSLKFENEIVFDSFNDKSKLLRSYQTLIELLNKINVQIQNYDDSQIHIYDKNIKSVIDGFLDISNDNKRMLEDKAFDLVCDLLPQTKTILANEKGIGKNLAIYLFPVFYFNQDKNYKQIISYLGLSPKVFESGSSVKKKSIIDKKGNSNIRKALFLSSLSCVRYNPKFKRYYEHLLTQNKNKKVALVAVCNKIIRHLKNQYFRY
ncbi:IS110 family transposase [Campylobacter hyointestinalis]|uniref:IS110 family transposase n=1 Tax=Campylobacter hyointestinalis TaxID=198 RepID=UPI000DCBCE77|nr:transposase [Campylobacter hyointestinalis]RAZ50564.1 IS110 family transposase [Campylobacter hyointestinalis subsp. lawsonii]